MYALVLLALSAGCVDVLAERQGELRYAVDHEALKKDFRSTGAFDLLVPGGTITVADEENSLCGDHCSPEHDHVHVLGHVVGHPESTANFLLGDYGV